MCLILFNQYIKTLGVPCRIWTDIFLYYTDIFLRVQLASLVLSEPPVKRAHLGLWENLEVLVSRGSVETLDLLVTLETKGNQERTDCQYVIPFHYIKLKNKPYKPYSFSHYA